MKAELEHVRTNSGSSFARLSYSGSRFSCPYHTHPEVEVVVIDHSAGRCVVGDALGVFEAGDLFVIGAHVPHLFANHAGGRGPAVSRYIQFRPDRLGTDFWQLPELAGVVRLFERARRGLRLAPDAARRIEPLFATSHAAEGGRALSRLLDLLLELADVQADVLSEAPFDEAHPDATRLGRALDLMHARFHERLLLGQVAKRAGLSPSAFSRFFHRRTGKRFQDHLLELRLAEVRRRLRLDPEASVAETAFACGFNNLSNFNRLFRREVGASPREWRNARRE